MSRNSQPHSMRQPRAYSATPLSCRQTLGSKRVFKRFTDQEGDTISEIASNIDKVRKKIAQTFDQLGHERLANIDKTTAACLCEDKVIRESSHRQTMMIRDILQRLGQIEEQQQRLHVSPETREQDVLQMVPFQIISAMQTGLYNIVSENEYIQREWNV